MDSYKIPFPILLARESGVCKACNFKLSWGKIKVYEFVYMLSFIGNIYFQTFLPRRALHTHLICALKYFSIDTLFIKDNLN